MKQCMADLRDGWYGNKAWRDWCAAGKPNTIEGTVDGQTLTEEERCSAARARFGKGKTAADWIPRDCHMSNAARVCPPVQPRQSNPAPRSAPTCPASLFGGAPTRGRDAPSRLAGGELLRIHLM